MIAKELYPKLWILPNPGDAGSSLGSAAYVHGKHINWTSPFTGYDIEGKYPTTKVLMVLAISAAPSVIHTGAILNTECLTTL